MLGLDPDAVRRHTGLLAQRDGPPDVEALADQDRPVDAEDLLGADAGVPGVEPGVVADDAPVGNAVLGQIGAHGVGLVVVLAAVVAGHEDDLDPALAVQLRRRVQPVGQVRGRLVVPQPRAEDDGDLGVRHVRGRAQPVARHDVHPRRRQQRQHAPEHHGLHQPPLPGTGAGDTWPVRPAQSHGGPSLVVLRQSGTCCKPRRFAEGHVTSLTGPGETAGQNSSQRPPTPP